METPVVATRAMGNPELVGHEAHGLLVPPRDPEALAAAVLRLLADPAWARALGTGRPRARRRGLLDAREGRAARAPLRARGAARPEPGPIRAGLRRWPAWPAATTAPGSGAETRAGRRPAGIAPPDATPAATIPARNRRERLQAPPSVRPPLLVLARRRGSPGHRRLGRRRPHRVAREAGDGRDLHPARPDDAEAPPARHPRRLRGQGHGAVRPVVPHGLRRRAGHRRAPARPLRAHPGHAARLLPEPPLRRSHVPRRGRRRPPGPPVLRGPGHGLPAGLHRRRAAGRHGHAGAPPHAPGPDRVPPRRADDPRHGPAALHHQPPDAGADRRAEHGAPGSDRRHQDRQGVRPRGARAGPLRPGQSPAAGALAEGSPRRRALRADHGDPGGARADGHPLVRRLPGDPGRHDARHPLLVRHGHPDALRPGPEAVPDRQPRPADHALRRADLRDPRPRARRRRRAGRGHAGRLPPGDRVRPRVVPVRGRRDGAQGHLPDRPAGRGGRAGGHERRRQVDPDGPHPALPRRHARAASSSTASTSGATRRRRCATRSRSSPRTPSCSTTRSRRTSPTASRERRARRSSAPRAPPTPTTSSSRWPRATRR